MLSAEEIAALRDASIELTQPIIDYLIRDLAERISKAGQFTATAQYETWKLQQLGISQKQIKKQLKKLIKVSNRELRQLLTQGAEVGYNFDMRKLPQVQAVPFEQNAAIQQLVSAAVTLAQDDLTNITQTLGMVDPWGNAQPLQAAYRKSMDFAFMQVSTGAADYNTAIRQATKNLAEKGVLVIDYESGVHTSLEAAVRRNIMGGLGIMQEQISRRNHDEMGADGWEIDAHNNSAPDHEPIQGRQYPDAEYEALNNSLVRRIGTLNCGHSAYPIIMGVNRPQYTPEQLEAMRKANEEGFTYNGRHYTGYEATQRQRVLETAMRKQKRRILVDETTGDAKKLQNDQIRLQMLRQEYARFSKTAGLRTQNERAEVSGFSWKQAGEADKVYKNYQKELEKQAKFDKMVSEIKTAGNLPKSAAVHIPRRTINTENLSFDNDHINVERQHHVTRDEAVTWIEESKMSVSVWNGQFERYYSLNGAAYVQIEAEQIRTAFPSAEFDDRAKGMLEVLKKYGY